MLRGLRSIIPAAGEATRLRPHTLVKQKPMLPMGSDGKKIIDWSLNIASQTESTTVTLHFDESKTKDLENHLESKKDKVAALRDSRRMGAASLIAFSYDLFEPYPEGNSLILPADHVVENINLSEFYEKHLEMDADVTILGVDIKPYGQYIHAHNGTVGEISDHPGGSEYMSSSGIYIISNIKLLEWIARNKRNGWNGEHRSFMRDFITPLIYTGNVVSHRLPDESYWDDAGTIKRYYDNNMRLSLSNNVLDDEATIGGEATVSRSVLIGSTAIKSGIIDAEIISSDGLNQYSTKIYNRRQ